MRVLILIFAVLSVNLSYAQKFKPTADFRFRVEQDWANIRQDGSMQDPRTRFRYRFRFGFDYAWSDEITFGARIRTGAPGNQQDPQLTLGAGYEEFDVLPIGFEKVYFQYQKKWFTTWLGKNTFPFYKQHELFWSDNVYPEGVYVSAADTTASNYLNSVQLGLGHFVIRVNGKGLDTDAYFQGAQLKTQHFNKRLTLSNSLYYFSGLDNIPDGSGTYTIDYLIFSPGFNLQLLNSGLLHLEFDYYNNLMNLANNDSIPVNLNNQTQGIVAALEYGKLKEKGDWKVKTTFTYLERYSAVDFIAQNDWTRWSYSSQGSPAGRLTNFQGIEFMAGYAINKKFTLKTRYFFVEQLVPYGNFKESGNRIRFDLDIGF